MISPASPVADTLTRPTCRNPRNPGPPKPPRYGSTNVRSERSRRFSRGRRIRRPLLLHGESDAAAKRSYQNKSDAVVTRHGQKYSTAEGLSSANPLIRSAPSGPRSVRSLPSLCRSRRADLPRSSSHTVEGLDHDGTTKQSRRGDRSQLGKADESSATQHSSRRSDVRSSRSIDPSAFLWRVPLTARHHSPICSRCTGRGVQAH